MRQYNNIWESIQPLLIGFPSSYLVEQAFSSVNNILTKKRNRLNLLERKDIRVFLSNNSDKEDMFEEFYKTQEEEKISLI